LDGLYIRMSSLMEILARDEDSNISYTTPGVGIRNLSATRISRCFAPHSFEVGDPTDPSTASPNRVMVLARLISAEDSEPHAWAPDHPVCLVC
jgi:hypothetical protein